LPHDDPRFDNRYAGDKLKVAKPFSQGPRGCPGGVIAATVIRLFLAEVIWEYDLERVQGQKELAFYRDFRFLMFWEKPQYWVRFKPVQKAD
jgi:cytochrome P450